MRAYEIPVKDRQLESPRLKQMFNRQRRLLDLYIPLQGIPAYPLDINLPHSQNFLRALAGFHSEELVYESLEELEKILVGLVNPSVTTLQEKNQLFTLLDFNEEIADVFHFVLEVMIYLGMDEYFIEAKTLEFCEENNFLPLYDPTDILRTLFDIARHINSFAGITGMVKKDLLRDNKVFEDMSLLQPSLDKFTAAGRRMSMEHKQAIDKLVLDVMRKLYGVTHELKNKPWKQVLVKTDNNRLSEKALDWFTQTIILLEALGMNEESLHTVYVSKSEINFQRIKDQY